MIFIFFTNVGIEPTLLLHCTSTYAMMAFFALDFGETLYVSFHFIFFKFLFCARVGGFLYFPL
jgi:hypothetical protein